MPKLWRTLLTLSCAVALVFLLWRSPPKELKDFLENTDQRTPNHPTSYILGARTLQYTESGELDYSLNAQKINYFETTNNPTQPEIILEQPHLIIYDQQEGNAPWVLSSKTAEGNEKVDELILIDDVVIKQTQENGSQTQFTTTRLTIEPNRRYAETDKPVIITDITGTTKATGLKVFFDEKRIELLSNVRGTYAASQ